MPNKLKIRKHNITSKWEYYNSITKKWEMSSKPTDKELFQYYTRTKQNFLLSYENDVYPEYTHEIQKTLFSYDLIPEITELLTIEQLEDNEAIISGSEGELFKILLMDIREDEATKKILLIVNFEGGTRPFEFIWKLFGKIISTLSIHYVEIERLGKYSVTINDANGLSINSSRLVKPEDLIDVERSQIIPIGEEDKLKIDLYA